jgi:hypothetical protein
MPQTTPTPPPRALPAEQHAFLKAVYVHFQGAGDWPVVATLQRSLAKSGSNLDLARIIRQLPSDLGYQDLGNGTAVLNLSGIWAIGPASKELEDFMLAMSHCVALYYGDEDKPILRSADLVAEGLDQLRLKKLHILLQREPYLTAGGAVHPDGSWELHVRDTAREFRGAKSVPQYLGIKARLDRDAIESGIDPSIWRAASIPMSTGPAITRKASAPAGSLAPLFVFVSHTHEHRIEVSELASHLRPMGFTSFIAHEMIEPTSDWQTEIQAALHRCDLLIAYITDDFHSSSWTDQEVGWVLGRGRPIVAIQSPKTPYGFIAKFQGLSASRFRTSYALAYELGRAVVNAALTSQDEELIERLTEQVVNSFCASQSYDSTRRLLGLLRLTPGRWWTSERIERLRTAAVSNSQIAEAVDERVGVPILLDSLAEAKGKE